MKKLLILLLILSVTCTGCISLSSPLPDASVPLTEVHSHLPQPRAPAQMRTQDTVTLYFRYLDEPYLAPQTRQIVHSPGISHEMAMISTLLAGPDVQMPELNACFPSGVQVLSTIRQGRTLFVTLSAEIMNAYSDEPASWHSDPYWAYEAPLRRQLAMQSLAATITENCDVDSVQVLVEQSGYVTDSLRLKQRYYLTTDSSTELAPALTRDTSLLLTPENTLRVILTLWQARDWMRLKRYVTPEAAPDWSNLPHLTEFSLSDGSVSPDGQIATFALTAALRRDHTDELLSRRIIRLDREGDLWRISPSQLTGWLEDLP